MPQTTPPDDAAHQPAQPPLPAQRDEAVTTSDPERIRALAHPLRLAILDLLDDEGQATATRCAEVTGESVASCSFHLRMLAKYGFVEPAERVGREKPWKPVGAGRTSRYDPEQPESLRAAGELARIVVGQEAARITHWIDGAPRQPHEWLLASVMTKSSFWATPAELAELSRELQAITDRFEGRWAHPELRPEGSRPARLFGVVNADPFDPDAPPSAAAPPAPGAPTPGSVTIELPTGEEADA
ncbi:ArsR family transcriptional regulator [Oerskovia turbata]|uniref:ArsR family transcriptional regulator n=1 Tax=Oerskovia turbata TaxID=1713 RepID=A0A4Q1KZX4_9CELL|nr:helix-turn-helix domain-containing protein [Oerskovia turbata]RXR28008.1 ArsR family transcriptional regulator [Oerskovia turbata]RXR35983.1 ArsR family transcriptional regulator [Oerskovia turbata]TGJ94895.1 ArsR family transcriptional regulator [Actinotalea fermentans ATCC 43279 = JCM 9966 = DSM 3133]